ncbi:MAG: SAF domain-containing protein [Holosporaceae bacterium]|jgi:Flp pilus assembly protein CpaB|nr:SAF domain-containing protein [Holosporaceae bacterium]
MNGRKDIFPMMIAAVVALAVTLGVRWLLPIAVRISSNDQSKVMQKKDIALPDIPLMVKETLREKGGEVLVVSNDVKKDAKISLANLAWKKWPQDAIQPHFIAKDEAGVALNNKADYNNALKMWAASNIPAGTPLSIRMLTKEDPEKKKKDMEEKRKKEEEQKKKEELEREKKLIRKGRRAVTFSVDSKSAHFVDSLAPGDLIDVIIMGHSGDRIRTYKYKALRVIAVSDNSALDKKNAKKKQKEEGLFSGLAKVGGILNSSSITLEVKEKRVEEMLRLVGDGGIILSLRNPKDGEKDDDDEDDETDENISLLHSIFKMNRVNSPEILSAAKNRKESEGKEHVDLMHRMKTIGGGNIAAKLTEAQNHKKTEEAKLNKGKDAEGLAWILQQINLIDGGSKDKLMQRKENRDSDSPRNHGGTPRKPTSNDISALIGKMNNAIHDSPNPIVQVANKKSKESVTGQYEVVSGRIIAEMKKENEKENKKVKENVVVTVHRQLKIDKAVFDANGKKLDNKTEQQTPTALEGEQGALI